MMKQGLKHTSTLVVTEERTAMALGSGDMPVLATPAMMAVADELPEGSTTVGGQIASTHLAPTPIGAEVTATAVLEKVEGRKLFFHVEARQGDTLIGEGEHLRFVVERERFLARLSR